MKLAVVALLAVTGLTATSVQAGNITPVTLERAVENATLVAVVSVDEGSNALNSPGSDDPASCGLAFSGDVGKVLKGSYAKQRVRFHLDVPLKVGATYVLFLVERSLPESHPCARAELDLSAGRYFPLALELVGNLDKPSSLKVRLEDVHFILPRQLKRSTKQLTLCDSEKAASCSSPPDVVATFVDGEALLDEVRRLSSN